MIKPEKKSKFDWGRLLNFFAVLFILSLILSLGKNWVRISKTDDQITEKESKVNELKRKNEELKEKLDEVSSDKYVERQIRDNLGLSKDGEIVIVLPEDDILRKLAPYRDQEVEVLPDPNWKKWLNLFL